jgi:hypothetical protein
MWSPICVVRSSARRAGIEGLPRWTIAADRAASQARRTPVSERNVGVGEPHRDRVGEAHDFCFLPAMHELPAVVLAMNC